MARSDWFDEEAAALGGEANTLLSQVARGLDEVFDHLIGRKYFGEENVPVVDGQERGEDPTPATSSSGSKSDQRPAQ